MKIKKINNASAMTLIEIMVALLIFSFVVSGVYTAFMVGNRSWLIQMNNVALQQEVRGALFFMVQELREANSIFITKDPESITMNFRRPKIGVVSYAWSRNGTNANKIVRQNNSDTKILAKDISFLSFAYLKNAVLIDIVATKTPTAGAENSFHLKEKVALRTKVDLSL